MMMLMIFIMIFLIYNDNDIYTFVQDYPVSVISTRSKGVLLNGQALGSHPQPQIFI